MSVLEVTSLAEADPSPSATPDETKIEIFFSPSKDCEVAIAKSIDEAVKSIDVAVYAINNKAIMKSLLKANQRKIPIRILTDSVRAADKTSKSIELFDQGVNLRVNSHHKIKIMHNKFAIFDEKKVVTGSFNWTVPASAANYENCLFINEAKSIQLYQKNFEILWEGNPADESQEKIKKIKSKRKKTL